MDEVPWPGVNDCEQDQVHQRMQKQGQDDKSFAGFVSLTWMVYASVIDLPGWGDSFMKRESMGV